MWTADELQESIRKGNALLDAVVIGGPFDGLTFGQALGLGAKIPAEPVIEGRKNDDEEGERH